MISILVTGGTGFLGKHLVTFLASLPMNITILLRKDSLSDHKISSSVNLLYIDDEINLSKLTNNIDCILHLATCYGREGETREEIYETNLNFGVKVLEMAKKIKTKYFINFDTSLPGHVNNYSSSKATFRSTCKKYASNGLKVINLRIESIYGPNKKGTDFSNVLIRACMQNKESIELSKCEQIRDFIFYKDLIHCVKLILR